MEERQELVQRLSQLAKVVRQDVIQNSYKTGSYHYGASLSMVEILCVLYFHKMRIDPTRPDWPDRDRFVLSKGHGSAALYSVLARKGFFPLSELETMKTLGSRLQGHCDMLRTPGVEFTTGSLGHGLAAAQGMALALRMDGRPSRVYCIIGDGECNEGLIWETSMSAPKFQLDNLVCILDRNGFQSCGATSVIMPTLEPTVDKWRAFGWHVLDIDGHDIAAIADALDEAESVKGKPTFIVARTIKGKGISFMENNNRFHVAPINESEYQQAMQELSEGVAR